MIAWIVLTARARMQWLSFTAMLATPRFTRSLPWALWALACGLTTLALVLDPAQAADELAFLAFPTVGALVASRRPDNPIGWLFCALGFPLALERIAKAYATYGLITHVGAAPGAVIAAWLVPWLWITPVVLIASALLLFPDGRPPSPRWWPVLWLIVGPAVVVVGAFMLKPGPLDDADLAVVVNPFGIAGFGDLLALLGFPAMLLLLCGFVASMASLVVRMRVARGDQRQQLKWVAFAAGVLVFAFVVNFLTRYVFQFGADLPGLVGTIALAGVPVAAGLAILRYRLYAIDLVINKALVYGALALMITAMYVGVVAGAEMVVRAGPGAKPVQSLLAAACVAVAFQPLRERLQRVADRLVYGNRADPYQVLADLSQQLAAALSVDEVLPQMAEAAARAVDATRSRVRVYLPAGGERAVWWPPGSSGGRIDATIAITHGGDVVGELAVAKPPSEPLTPAEDRLLRDLAAPAGLALSNVRLASELRAHLDEIAAQAGELEASRQRIVAAQEAERRRLERDLHDGAQQRLVVLAMHLRRATSLVANDADAVDVLETLAVQALEIHAGLRDLARGISPPLLRDQGLVPAINAHAARAVPRTRVAADAELSTARFDSSVEAAVYFCCLEALQNAGKHANAAAITVRLSCHSGCLWFSVMDDGHGFEPATARVGSGLRNMTDRLAALGGTLVVDAAVGRGTTVTGRVPLVGEGTAAAILALPELHTGKPKARV